MHNNEYIQVNIHTATPHLTILKLRGEIDVNVPIVANKSLGYSEALSVFKELWTIGTSETPYVGLYPEQNLEGIPKSKDSPHVFQEVLLSWSDRKEFPGVEYGWNTWNNITGLINAQGHTESGIAFEETGSRLATASAAALGFTVIPRCTNQFIEYEGLFDLACKNTIEKFEVDTVHSGTKEIHTYRPIKYIQINYSVKPRDVDDPVLQEYESRDSDEVQEWYDAITTTYIDSSEEEEDDDGEIEPDVEGPGDGGFSE